jgi:hypothetical protein
VILLKERNLVFFAQEGGDVELIDNVDTGWNIFVTQIFFDFLIINRD